MNGIGGWPRHSPSAWIPCITETILALSPEQQTKVFLPLRCSRSGTHRLPAAAWTSGQDEQFDVWSGATKARTAWPRPGILNTALADGSREQARPDGTTGSE